MSDSTPKPAVRAPGRFGIKSRLAEMIRVDHAGEYGAVAIYRGQRAVFSRSPRTGRISRQIGEMAAQEQGHLDAFDKLIADRGVRPTAMAPLWEAAGFTLGAVTALMGERAAHACTEAVEDVIEKHYQDQIDELDEAGEEPELKAAFTQFRAEELEHRDLAVEEGAKDAPGYALLSRAIKTGCKLAIGITRKV